MLDSEQDRSGGDFELPRHLLSIGYIPKNCSADRILCGDPESSGTREVTLSIVDDENLVRCLEKEGTVTASADGWFNKRHKMWKDITKAFAEDLSSGEAILKPEMIAACWAILLQESDGQPGIELVAEEDDCGEFDNTGGIHNGKFYVRYQWEDDGEYSEERVVVF